MLPTVIRLIARGTIFALALGLSVGCVSGPATYTKLDLLGVVECEFADQGGSMELPQSYYNDYFSSASSGTGRISDYFKQVSYNKVEVGAVILGPYTIPSTYTQQYYGSATPMTLNQYMGLERGNQVTTCLGAAVDAGANLTPYREIIALQVNREHLAAYGGLVFPATSPTVMTTVTAPVTSLNTTIHVQSSAGFPTPPFPAFVAISPTAPAEDVKVTAESGPSNTTWTVIRGFQPRFPAVPHAVGEQVWTAFAADIGTPAPGGLVNLSVGTGNHQEKLAGVGLMVMDPLAAPSVVAHEIGHGLFNLGHSKDLISQQSDYHDAWDVMSVDPAYDKVYPPNFAINAINMHFQNFPNVQFYWEGGPGFNTVNLDYVGWLSPQDEDTIPVAPTNSCTSHGITLDALSQKASDKLEARLPYTNQPGFPAYGQHYTVEFRNNTQNGTNTIWDSNIPEPTVLVHLAVAPSPGADPYISYLVDGTVNGALFLAGANPGGLGAGGTPEFVVGSTFVDPTSHAYLAVNQIDGSASIARVTTGNCSLPTTLSYVGATSAVSGGTALLAANLMTKPSVGTAWPVPNQSVTFSIGNPQSNLSCSAVTDSAGHAECTVTVLKANGSAKVKASFVGTTAYQAAASTSVPFQVI